MFGKSSRHTCDPSDDESPYRSDEALNDLGSARRNDITTTTGTRRERGRAREFDRLEREQRVNEGRDMAVDAGWFKLQPIDGEEEHQDIFGGQSHRVDLEHQRRAEESNGRIGRGGDVRNSNPRPEPTARFDGPPQGTTLGSRTTYPQAVMNRARITPIQSGQPVQPVQQEQSLGTYVFKNLTMEQRAEVNRSSQNIITRGPLQDPALDHELRKGHLGAIKPGARPQPVLSSSNNANNKNKSKKASDSGPKPSIAAFLRNGPPPNVHPMFQGPLVVNQEEVPASRPLTQAKIEIASMESSAPVASPEMPVVAQPSPTSQDASDCTSEPPMGESLDDALTGLEEPYSKLFISEAYSYSSSDPGNEVEAEDSPSTTPEPVTPIAKFVQPVVASIDTPSLIDDEPDQAEIQKLPEAISPAERLLRATCVPVGNDENTGALHAKAIASTEAFADYMRNIEPKARHKIPTNTSQFISDGFKNTGLMASRFA